MSGMTKDSLDRRNAGVKNKKFFGLFIYLWVLLTLFSFHTAFIFNQSLLAFQQVFALINALLLAKIIVSSHALQLGRREKGDGVLIAAVIKSALFSLILLLLNVAEEAAMGVYRGDVFWEAIPTIGDGSLQAILMTAIIAGVGLIPLFAVIELEVPLGAQELNVLLFGQRRAGAGNGEHVEKHFLNSETVRDVVIGMADGLTVPFALAAGISAAIASTHVVVTAGMAEIVAGATARRLGPTRISRASTSGVAQKL